MIFAGEILDTLGNMKTFDGLYEEAGDLLNDAAEYMRIADSEMGQTRVSHHLAVLK